MGLERTKCTHGAHADPTLWRLGFPELSIQSLKKEKTRRYFSPCYAPNEKQGSTQKIHFIERVSKFFSVLSPSILSPLIQPYECFIYIQSLSPSWKAFSEIKLLFFWDSPVNGFPSHPVSSATEPPWSTDTPGLQKNPAQTISPPNKNPLPHPEEQDLFSYTAGCHILNNYTILNIRAGDTLFWSVEEISGRLHPNRTEVTRCHATQPLESYFTCFTRSANTVWRIYLISS